MSRRVAFAACCAFVAAACDPLQPDGEQTARRPAEIVGGTPVPTGQDPAVVAIAVESSGQFVGFCTGVLIGFNTVLTAAHCSKAYAPTATYYALAGTTVAAPSEHRKVVQRVAHPDHGAVPTMNADLGLLKLASPFRGVTPLPLNSAPMGIAHLGLEVRHVGFGSTSAGGEGWGIKREGTWSIRAFLEDMFESGALGRQTCQGDSGGPGLAILPGQSTASVIGIVSFGDASCASAGWDTRVDFHLAWILQTMAPWEEPSCDRDGRCKTGCTLIDLDCVCGADGACSADCPDLASDPDCPADCGGGGVCSVSACPVPDPDCVAEGEACRTDLDCLTRTCVGDPQHSWTYCSRPCTQDAQCAPSMECEGGACRFVQRAAAGIGEPCTADTLCLGGTTCNGQSANELRCHFSCTRSSDCPSATDTCIAGTTGANYCQPTATEAPTSPGGGSADSPAQPSAPAQSSCSTTGAGPGWIALTVGLLAARRGRSRSRGRLARLVAVAGAAAAIAACGSGSGGRGTAEQSEIVGGTTDLGDPEVFLLDIAFGSGGRSICSGTLIAPRTLVTAAHCLDTLELSASGASVRATNRTNAASASASEWLPVVAARIHPGWDSRSSLDDDIALLLLGAAPDVPAKPWNRTSLAGLAGKQVRLVGYGVTAKSASDWGVKREVSLVVNAVDVEHLYIGDGVDAGICHGDSGGPTLHTFPDGVERLAGIHSYDANQKCTNGADLRIDAYGDFIDEWLRGYETGDDCALNGVCAIAACPTPDLDCLADGESCASALQCPGRECVTDPQHPAPFCSRACASNADCPSGMECPADGGVCLFTQLPVAAPGDRCHPGATFCSGGTVCAGEAGGGAWCSKPCVTNSDCGVDATCGKAGGGARYCRRGTAALAPQTPLPSPAGAGCSTVAGGPLVLLLVAGWRRARLLRRGSFHAPTQ